VVRPVAPVEPVAPAEAAPTPVPAPPASSRQVDPRTDTGPIVRPPVESGDLWVYRRSNGRTSVVMTQSATRVSPEGIALRTELAGSPDSSTALYDRDWGLVASGYNDYLPSLHYYAFPLYVGKRWGIDSAVSNFGAGQVSRVKGEARAVRWEEIEVPAGKFLALKIDIDIELADPGDPARKLRVLETHWYARTVLRAIKVESHSVIEGNEPSNEVIDLLSYKLD